VDQRVLAPPHGFSQLATSFLACPRLGILRAPLPRLASKIYPHDDRNRFRNHDRRADHPASAPLYLKRSLPSLYPSNLRLFSIKTRSRYLSKNRTRARVREYQQLSSLGIGCAI
jgi:hypothetical protein